MSKDEAVTKDIIETLEDGREGFARGAERLAGDADPQLADTFRTFSSQRAQFSAELRAMAASYGDHIEQNGSVVATLHRGWLTLKDALTGDDPKGVLRAAHQGERHAVSEYEKALGHDDLSSELRLTLQRQLTEVRAAADTVAALAESRR